MTAEGLALFLAAACPNAEDRRILHAELDATRKERDEARMVTNAMVERAIVGWFDGVAPILSSLPDGFHNAVRRALTAALEART